MHQARHDAELYRRVELITGGRRRRDWTNEEKARIVAESADPDANISEVARQRQPSAKAHHDRRLGAAGAVPGVLDCAASDGRIEIEIADARVFVPLGADVATLRNVVAALRSAR